MNRGYPGQRPLIDLDLGHAHQYGYRNPRFIPSASQRDGWPTRPSTTTTRTPEQETRR